MNIFNRLCVHLSPVLLLLLFALLSSSNCNRPQSRASSFVPNNSAPADVHPPTSVTGPFGGATLTSLRGANHPERTLTDAGDIRQTIRTLQQEGTLAPFEADKIPSFIQPIQLVDAPIETSIIVAQFVDHDLKNPGYLQDYRCNSRTYDFNGYNHSGTDFIAYPFPWRLLDTDSVTVVAAAAGIILRKEDGHSDRNCGLTNTRDNVVVLVHADGSQSTYAHMKKGSVTTKAVGETIEIGEYLGVVGSSGASTAPHLHFEVKDPAGNLIDPFFDPANASCNTLNQKSWWATQPAYYDPGINKLMTSSAKPALQQCGEAITHESNAFLRGETIHLSAFYRHQFADEITNFQLKRPDGSIALEWSHQIDEPFIEFSMWTWSITLDPESPVGRWIAQAKYRDTTYTHSFAITDGLRDNLDEKNFLPLIMR